MIWITYTIIMTNRQIIRQFVSWFAPKADKLVIEIPCISWILYVLSLTYINLIAYNLIINGTNWHFLALANCYKPNRSKVFRRLSAKCHECRILSYQGYRIAGLYWIIDLVSLWGSLTTRIAKAFAFLYSLYNKL